LQLVRYNFNCLEHVAYLNGVDEAGITIRGRIQFEFIHSIVKYVCADQAVLRRAAWAEIKGSCGFSGFCAEAERTPSAALNEKRLNVSETWASV